MNEIRNDNNYRMTRRELVKFSGAVLGGTVITGGLSVGFAELVYASDEQQRTKDHYNGTPLTEYAKGSFEIKFAESYIAQDPITSPDSRYSANLIRVVNGKYVGSGEFYISNPGIIRASSPDSSLENAAWAVLNAQVVVQAKGWKQLFPEYEDKLLYAYLSDQENRLVKTATLETNPEGKRISSENGRQVDYLGVISFRPTLVGFHW